MAIKEINNRPYNLTEYIKKLKAYAFLITSLSKREIKIKYSKAILGLGWVFIQPIMAVIVYSIFFNNFIKIDTNHIPYVQFVFSGLVFWYLFTGIISRGCNSLLESSDLINKVSFPRIILVVAKSVPVLIEGIVLFVILVGIVVFSGQPVGLNILWSLFYFIEVVIFSFALALLFSVLVIQMRDFVHIIPFFINFGIWLTPVFYPVSIVPAQYQNYLKYLNPIANSIEGLRGALFMGKAVNIESLMVLLFSLVLLFISFLFFIKFEKKIVEQL